MIDVTVVLVEGGMPSTAVAPVEVFSTAGVLWNSMRGLPAEPRFRVRTVSQDGKKVSTAVNLNLEPGRRLDEVDADLIIVSAVGTNLEAACRANAPLYPGFAIGIREAPELPGSVPALHCWLNPAFWIKGPRQPTGALSMPVVAGIPMFIGSQSGF